jgi:hypothetical protein
MLAKGNVIFRRRFSGSQRLGFSAVPDCVQRSTRTLTYGNETGKTNARRFFFEQTGPDRGSDSRQSSATARRRTDLPTTLMTSRRVIDKVDAFWGTGERKFKEHLEDREIKNFCRAISDIIAEEDLPEACVKVVSMAEFEELVKSK